MSTYFRAEFPRIVLNTLYVCLGFVFSNLRQDASTFSFHPGLPLVVHGRISKNVSR